MRLAPLLLAALMGFASVAGAAAQEARPLFVFAAASLKTSLDRIVAEWQASGRGRVSVSYAASSALARQMEQGAPADLFASADTDWMDWSAERRLVRTDTRRDLLGNSLVLIAPRDTTDSISIGPNFPLAQALGDSRLAVGEPDSVPAGRYARTALTSLGVWDSVRPRLAAAPDVRAALTLVARGEARYGIVYATDAAAEPRVRVVGTFPAGSHAPIVYPFAVTTSSTHPEAAAFLAFLREPAATRIFQADGFTILP